MEANQKNKKIYKQGTSMPKHAGTLLHENHLLRNMMENMQLIAIMLDMNANITFCNDHFLNITGWKREEVLGMNWFKVFVKGANENAYQVFQSAIENQKIISHYENTITTKGKSERLVKWNNALLYDEDGKVIGAASIGEDITEKKIVEDALRKSDERLQVFFNQSLDGFFFCNFEEPREWKNARNKEEILEDIIHTQRFTDVNNAMLKQYNISRDDFLKLTTKDVFAHDLEQGRRLRRELFDNGRLHLETNERRTDGTPVWFEGDYVCLYDDKERITGFFGIQRDITGRKESEIALRESEERYRSLFSGMLDGVYRSSHEGRFLDVNPAMVKMFGYESREEMLQLNIKKALYFSPEERESLFMDTGEEKVDIFRMKRKDSSEIWVEDHGRYVHDEDGNVIFHEGILRDVTERKYAEEALREAERKYRSIFENAVEGIYQSSPEGRFLTVNPAFAHMLGFASPQEMIAVITDIAHQTYGETSRRKDFMQQLEKHGNVSGFEYQMRRKDNSMIWVSENARVVHSAEGKILYYEGIVEDITARKNAENALMESEWRNRVVAEMTTDYTFIIDVDHNEGNLKLRWASENLMRLTGGVNTKLGISIWKKIIHREDIHAFLEFVRQMLVTGKASEIECRTSAKSGGKRWVEINARPLKNEHGLITVIVGAIKDVSERKHTEEQLLLQSAALNAAANSIMISDDQGNIEWVNPAYAKYSGYSLKEVIGKNPRILKSGAHDNVFYKNIWDTILSGQVWHGEIINRRKDGTNYTAEETITPILGGNNRPTHFIGITQDISERKQHEQRIDKQLKRLNALHAIDNAIKSSTDLRTTLEVLLKEVVVQLKADAACVLLFNKNTLTLEYTAGRGFRAKAVQHTRLGAGQGYAGQVISDRKPIHIPNLRKTENKLFAALSVAGENFTDYIGAPLIAKGQIVGVLEIFQRTPFTPDTDWFDFLDMLAGQTAIAVDSAQMFENLQRSNFELTLAYDATIEGWSHALDLRDKETEGHTQRVTSLTLQLAQKMGIPDSELLHIRRGALLHDIGKMGIPDNILHKPDALTKEEWEIMHRHTIYATEMLTPISYLRPALDIPRHHHEKWDGMGYPQGLKGNEIPLSARIFAVVDVWDAITSDRPYRMAWSNEKAIKYLKSESGKHFDPDVVNIFLSLIENKN